MLTYIEGESGREGWFKILPDEGLANFARLLKCYHEAIADYRPPKDVEWAYGVNALKPGEVMCHGDFGPWNIVWNGETPVGILDWDFTLPAKPTYDVFYALQYSVPFRDDETTLAWHHFPEVPDRRHRVQIFLDAYGMDLPKIVDGVVAVQRQDIAHVKHLADRGLRPQLDWIKEGILDKIEYQAQWSENNRALFE